MDQPEKRLFSYPFRSLSEAFIHVYVLSTPKRNFGRGTETALASNLGFDVLQVEKSTLCGMREGSVEDRSYRSTCFKAVRGIDARLRAIETNFSFETGRKTTLALIF